MISCSPHKSHCQHVPRFIFHYLPRCMLKARNDRWAKRRVSFALLSEISSCSWQNNWCGEKYRIYTRKGQKLSLAPRQPKLPRSDSLLIDKEIQQWERRAYNEPQPRGRELLLVQKHNAGNRHSDVSISQFTKGNGSKINLQKFLNELNLGYDTLRYLCFTSP